MATDRTAPELKNFKSIFESIANRHGYFYVWEDYLNLFINGWSLNYHEHFDLKAIQKKYSEEEKLNFGKLINEMILVLDSQINSDKDWFDFLGTFYETYSLSKKQGFAQFFTPSPICNFMSQIINPQRRETFSDPCCGSGRFSLAANSNHLGMFHFLVDIDYTCAKMSAINLMMHGINGIVICDNGLFPGKDFKGAFIVNRKINVTGVPQIEFESDKSKAYNYVRFNTMSIQDLKDNTVENKTENFEDIQVILNKSTGQYQLF
ncbi:MAG: SAM-dependent DNA methyltransferase [Fusobacterium sp.]|nr:SAM-dependent DNA methyltransferase [Fusobacterium sp.]